MTIESNIVDFKNQYKKTLAAFQQLVKNLDEAGIDPNIFDTDKVETEIQDLMWEFNHIESDIAEIQLNHDREIKALETEVEEITHALNESLA